MDSELIQDLVLTILLDDSRLAHPELGLVRGYLKGGGDSPEAVDQRRVQLSVQLARLVEEYGFSRPDLLAAWPRGLTLPEGCSHEQRLPRSA